MNGLTLPRFYPVLDTGLLAAGSCSVETAVEAVLEGGARIVQLRHKSDFTRTVLRAAERAAELCRRAGALLVIDDRADMARLVDASLHLGQDDLPPCEARKLLGNARTIGFSTHNETQLREAAGLPVDYIALGPIFATGSKHNPDAVVGLEALRRMRRWAPKPLVAIGGITRERAKDVLEAGADSVAVIGDLLPEEVTKQSLRARTEEWVYLLKK